MPAIEPNWLDRAISFVAPGKGAARMQARLQIARTAQVRNAYDAASIGRRTEGWRAVGSDANAETRVALSRIRDVARDMVRNNAFAARGKAVLAHSVVGTGILPSVKAARPAWQKRIAGLLTAHLDSTDIDADGRLNFYGLQELALGTIVEAGEVLIRRRLRRAEDGFTIPMQIQILEPDYLDTSFDGPVAGGNFAVQGVEFDFRGKRVAYYLFDEHPGSTTIGMRNYRGKRVSADFVTHVFRVDRPGQVRGVSWFAPVVARLRDYADLSDAQLMKQKIAACFAGFITGGSEFDDAAPGSAPADVGSPYPIEAFEPGMIERLGMGETIQFGQPPSTQDFPAYSKVTLYEIAVGLGVTYEALTGDLKGVNFSSGRLGDLGFQRSIESWRWNMLIPGMLGPVGRWLQEAIIAATGSSEPFSYGWTPPRREMIDPDTETKASVLMIRSGLNSRSDEIRQRGLDPEQVDREIAADNARADGLSLVLDSDPRKTSGAGLTQARPENTFLPPTDIGG